MTSAREIGIEVDRAEKRFERIGQRRSALASAARLFPATHHQVLPEVERKRVPAQRFARDQPRAQLRQSTFSFPRKKCVEVRGDNELQHGVPKKFEALVIEMMPVRFVSETRVSQRLRQQKRIAEFVTDTFLKWMHAMLKVFVARRFSRTLAVASAPLVNRDRRHNIHRPLENRVARN